MDSQTYVSDELTHFVGRAIKEPGKRYELFRAVVRGRSLHASFRDELGPGVGMLSDGQKPLSKNEAIKCTMLCFCDIPLSQLAVHMGKYGSFGIAFSKRFLLARGAMPVHYVARNAHHNGIGRNAPRSVGERFDELRREMQRVRWDLEQYVTEIDGPFRFLSKLPAPGTPRGHQVLGRFSAMQSEIEDLIFSGLKFFESGLPEEHEENYYMEREWRLREGLVFDLTDVARIVIPRVYEPRLREDIPEYRGLIEAV
jgi:Putative abortive phage resistance protein AbiGi, antitoxin